MNAHTWRESIQTLTHPRVITMFLFGISAGLPLALIFGSLSLWLREAGVDRSVVTFFSWAALGYSFKFVWAPIVDQLPLPFLSTRLGRRRAWILFAQFSVIASILVMAFINPALSDLHLKLMALACIILGFSSATQDIVIDAYRIESTPSDLQALTAASYITGYRVGMLLSGAGALYLAETLGSETGAYHYAAWRITYISMAVMMLIGVTTTLIIGEPAIVQKHVRRYSNRNYIRFFLVFILAVTGFVLGFHFSPVIIDRWVYSLCAPSEHNALANFGVELARLGLSTLAAGAVMLGLIRISFVEKTMIVDSYISPIMDFFKRYALGPGGLVLVLIGLYRISDIVLGVIANVFYQDMGYSKTDIATAAKTFGLFMTIIGGFLGGVLSIHFGIIRVLFVGALLAALTNLLFMGLAVAGHDITLLYVVIAADNLAGGLASAVFVAFLSRLTNISFTAMQYALFSSLTTLFPKLISGYSGTIVNNIGYIDFFLLTFLLGLPVLLVIYLLGRHLKFE